MTKVVDVIELQGWIDTHARDEGVVIPIPPPPVPPPPPPVSGQWTSIIAGAKKCNTKLDKIGGYGFYDRNTPGPTSVKSNGKTYFLFDPAWLTTKWKIVGKRLTIMWIDMSLTPNSKTSLYEIDSLDNGRLIGGPKGGTQDSFSFIYKPGVRWLVEVDTTQCPSGYALSIKWPY